jgi:cation diffusion facilitator CzcD-associated flavoprotein CzcO
VLGFVKYPRILRAAEAIARRHMRQSISDPALVDKVTPDYTLGCKRILPSNRWYPALDRDNVDLHIGGLQAVTRTGVVTADGVEHPVDAIIFGTGFRVTDMPVAHHIRGAGGRTLAEHWGPSMRAHRGCTVPGFPNLFMLLGPNTGLGHGSMVYMIESQLAYVLDALRTMRSRGAAVAEVREQAEAAWNRELDAKLEGTVWNSGCASWYADSTGRIAALWPDWTFAFRRDLQAFDADSYDLRAPRPAGEPVAA